MHASIVVAGGTNVESLCDLLYEVGVNEAWVLNGDIGDRYIFDPAPDFLVGVLSNVDLTDMCSTKSFSNSDVLLRMGLAAGRGIPGFLIAPLSIHATSPDPIITVVQCNLDSHEALADHIWAFTAALDHHHSGAHSQSMPRPLENIDEYLGGLERLNTGSGSLGIRFERLISRVLMKAGAAVSEGGATTNADVGVRTDDGVDIAFMPPGGSTDIILVELKVGHLSDKILADSEKQLQKYVIERRAKFGVLLYHDVTGRDFRRDSMPLILRIAAREFIKKLAQGTLPEVLDDALSRAVERM